MTREKHRETQAESDSDGYVEERQSGEADRDAGEMAQPGQCLLYKHADLTSSPEPEHGGTHLQSLCWGGRDKQIPGALLASQPS